MEDQSPDKQAARAALLAQLDKAVAQAAREHRQADRAKLRSQPATMRKCTWEAEDGYSVAYSTTRIAGGPNHGLFIAQLLHHERYGMTDDEAQVEVRVCATRAEAKRRALAWYAEHSPKWKARNRR